MISAFEKKKIPLKLEQTENNEQDWRLRMNIWRNPSSCTYFNERHVFKSWHPRHQFLWLPLFMAFYLIVFCILWFMWLGYCIVAIGIDEVFSICLVTVFCLCIVLAVSLQMQTLAGYISLIISLCNLCHCLQD